MFGIFSSKPSWHKRLSTTIVGTPFSNDRKIEQQVVDNGDQQVDLIVETQQVEQNNITDNSEENKIGISDKWGDGKTWNIVYKTINPDGKEIKEDYILDGFTKPINFCTAERYALIKLHNLHPENKFFDIKEISKLEETE